MPILVTIDAGKLGCGEKGLKLFSVAEMVAAEQAADAQGVSYAQLMETAGRSVAEAIMARYGVNGRSILILIGPGNNGGDGLVAGRYLAQAGADVAFYLTKMRDPEADPNFAAVQQMGLFTLDANFDQRYRVLRTRLRVTDILVDALLGTGVSRPIGGTLAKLMQQVQQGVAEQQKATTPQAGSLTSLHPLSLGESPSAALPIIAVDCPSGLNCNTGVLDPLALPASVTVTFAGPKRGHFIFPGAAACGELVVADIGIPRNVTEPLPVAVATAVSQREQLPKRPLDGHKGTFGRVLIAAGSSHYWGAPLLAALGAFRAGAGLVALAVPQAIRPTLAGQLPEATYPPVPDQEQLGSATAHALLRNIKHHNALLVGPGLGEAHEFMTTLLAAHDQLPPLLVDADGLNLLAQRDDWPQLLPPNTVLTPHPVEMARLTGMNRDDLFAADRIELARTYAQRWGHVVLLKGAYTVVAAPDGQATVLPFAAPVLAVGGSGDVLSGVIASLMAQGMAPYAAVVLGGYLHGLVGEMNNGRFGLLAHEIADLIPAAAQHLQNYASAGSQRRAR
ncbi:MAG: NAD(P)H-hydrate dehydratase [Anaerolineales bacterium]|nr:NAD(P)H-hydrate dehydratase [Anaerolineales bacterium]